MNNRLLTNHERKYIRTKSAHMKRIRNAEITQEAIVFATFNGDPDPLIRPQEGEKEVVRIGGRLKVNTEMIWK